MIKYLKFCVVFISLSAIGCESSDSDVPVSDFVYVKTNDVEVVVLIDAKKKAGVGEWIVLNATRETKGKWKQVGKSDLFRDEQWYTEPVSGMESQVAANVSWIVEPSKNYEFDVASL